jgi:hypothetical protein
MKRFISTKLIALLREASQKGVDREAKTLQSAYDKFASFVFSENDAAIDKTMYYDALVYTQVELASLTGVSGKKCGRLSKKSHWAA